MVRNILTVAFLWAVANVAFSADLCTKETEDDPPFCPLILPKIAKVIITKNAAKSLAEKDPAVRCEHFHIDKKKVRRFLKLAKVIDPGYTHAAVDWSPCSASGQVIFSDGRLAYWNMNQFRYGSLAFADTDESSALFCERCRFKPFMWEGVAWPYPEK